MIIYEKINNKIIMVKPLSLLVYTIMNLGFLSNKISWKKIIKASHKELAHPVISTGKYLN
jgi:hypothetical protein